MQHVFQKDQLFIRYPTMDDAEAMQHYFNKLSAEKTFIRSQGEQVSLKEEITFVENVLKNISDRKAIRLLAFLDNKLIGVSNIDMLDKTEKHLGELGLSIDKDVRGKGLATVFLDTLIKEAVKSLPLLEIIILRVFASNKAALNLYKKIGFVEHGRLPRGVKLENRYDDYIYMHKQVKL